MKTILATIWLCILSWGAYECFEGSCYQKGSSTMTWQDSKLYCENTGSVLTSIHSEAENQFINDLCGSICYIGMSDIDHEGDWKWIDGSTVNYTNWAGNEPNDYGGGEDTALINQNGAWNDITRHAKYYPVCKNWCEDLNARCYGSGSFGAQCNGSSTDINFPIKLSKATSVDQKENQETIKSHIEIRPSFSIDLSMVIKIRFDARVDYIAAGSKHGALLALSVKYDESNSQIFTLTQPIWASTSCADNQWHSWELIVYFDALEVYCDQTLVWHHARKDTQDSWEVRDESPFLAFGAFYSPIHESWFSRCDMLIHNVEILTCSTAPPSSSPSMVPTKSPTGIPTNHPTRVPTILPTRYPTRIPTRLPTSAPTNSCDTLSSLCYGNGAFGAKCDGPTNAVNFPETLNKATSPEQTEKEGTTDSHIEVYPTYSIDLLTPVKVRFDAQILDIAPVPHQGSVFTLSVKYDGSDVPIFRFSQTIWSTTSCNDTDWHSWEVVIYHDAVKLHCDEILVYTHIRTDSQETWQSGDKSPFFVIGAHHAKSVWFSRCDLIVQNIKIFTC